MAVFARVKFQLGKYKFTLASNSGDGITAPKTWVIGREDTGATIAFTFEEENAKHVCLALGLLDSFATGDRQAQGEFLRAFDKLKKD